MTNFKSAFLQEASWRGYVYQGTDLEALDALMAKESITAYLGFDATAPSLHVGSLTQIMRLRLLQKHGHKPLVLLGDGTTRIGDPSGKDVTRQMLSTESIEANIQGIQRVFKKYLTFGDGKSDSKLLRNGDWLSNLNYIDFLRDYGRHFTLNRMLGFESIKARLDREQPLTLIEFNYMIFQAYDFLFLQGQENCLLQLGGSDQWGNIVSGVDLIRREKGVQAFGLTGELITTADGKKMGKSANGAIWLNEDMLSVYDFWQFWRNTMDADVGRFLRLFTELPLQEIQKLESLQGSEVNEAKSLLATEVTKMCHGEEAALRAQSAAQDVFSNNAGHEDLPSITLEPHGSVSLIDALVSLELAETKGEARRLIRGSGARIDGEVICDENYLIHIKDLKKDHLRISAGKKRHGIIRS